MEERRWGEAWSGDQTCPTVCGGLCGQGDASPESQNLAHTNICVFDGIVWPVIATFQHI